MMIRDSLHLVNVKIVGMGTHEKLEKNNKYYIELQNKEFVSESPLKF